MQLRVEANDLVDTYAALSDHPHFENSQKVRHHEQNQSLGRGHLLKDIRLFFPFIRKYHLQFECIIRFCKIGQNNDPILFTLRFLFRIVGHRDNHTNYVVRPPILDFVRALC